MSRLKSLFRLLSFLLLVLLAAPVTSAWSLTQDAGQQEGAEAPDPQAGLEATAEAEKSEQEAERKAEEAKKQAQGQRIPRSELEQMSLEELEKQAATTVVRIEGHKTRIAEFDDLIETASGEGKTALETQKTEAQTFIDQNIKTLEDIVDLLGEKDSEQTSEYRAKLQDLSGKVQDITDVKAQLSFIQTKLEEFWTWIKDSAPGWIGRIIGFLLFLLVFHWLGRLAGKLVRRALRLSKLNLSDLMEEFFVSTTRKLIFFLGLVIALGSVFNINVAPFLAALGIGGFILGFALQETLNNFAAGLMIMLYRPYDVGDVITAGGVTGKVNSMTLVSTILITFDNQKEIVPNGTIWGGVITNITAMPTRRVDLTASIGYSDDIAKAQKVLTEIITTHPLVLKDPEPVVTLHELGASSLNFLVRPWSKTADYWSVYWDVTRSIKERFDAEGISIPFPQQDVHLDLPDSLAGALGQMVEPKAASGGKTSKVTKPKAAQGKISDAPVDDDDGGEDGDDDDTH